MFANKNRVLMLYLIFSLAFLILLGRLYKIQFIDGPQYSQQAVTQRQKTINYIQFPRGTIMDRNLHPLTNVEQQPCVAIFPVMINDISHTSELLARFLNLSPETVAGKIKYHTESDSETISTIVKEPFILKADASDQEVELINEAKLPGVYILPLIPRYQPGWLGVHILGSVGSINEEEYQENSFLGKYYRFNDIIGKSGFEKQYEDYLRGGSTERIGALVDVRGQHLEGSGFTLLSPEKGDKFEDNLTHLITTIDRDYQAIAEDALEGHDGAAVVMDVWNGNILAIASSPKFDPFMLETPTTNDAYINKALKNYPPASVFKILIAAAALEEGIVKPDDLFTCTGGIAISEERTVSCWNREGHGELTFTQAGAHSCNPVFIDIGLQLGGENIIKYAERFGLNTDEIIGYDIPKAQHIYFNPSVPGDIANVSIGENGISLSPVLVAKMISQVANGGFSVTPRLVSRIQDDQGKELEVFTNTTGQRIIRPDTAASLKSMLEMAVEEGTGKPAQVPGVKTAGKTGSSEISGVWFAGFAPVDVPRWAVVVFIQKGISGGKEAAPVFKKIVSELSDKENIL